MSREMKKVIRNRKGQSASEFMHTYGLVLAMIVMLLGVMTYMGVGKTKNLLPTGCKFLNGLSCEDMEVDEDLLKIHMLNEFGFAIRNLSVRLEGTCTSEANTSDINPYGNPNVILANQEATITFDCQNLTGDNVLGTLTVDYVNVDSGQNHTKVGRIEFRPGET
ncbi:hypothetical protein ACFL0V_06780 [Nanoarchaeota archaeon]